MATGELHRNDLPSGARPASRRQSQPLARFEACPKCNGQYLRDGWVCHCYQCCFEWDLRDDAALVLARALRRHRGERPADPGWAWPLRDEEPPQTPADRDGAA